MTRRSDRHQNATDDKGNDGDAEPSLRSLHARFHVLERIVVNWLWRGDIDTRGVELELERRLLLRRLGRGLL
jgi:hypothetical protein